MEAYSTLQLHRSFVRRRQGAENQHPRQQCNREFNRGNLFGRVQVDRKRKSGDEIATATLAQIGHGGGDIPNSNGHVVSTNSSRDTGNAVWDHYMTNYHDVPLGRFHNPMSPTAAVRLDKTSPMAMDMCLSDSSSRDSWSCSDSGMQMVDMHDEQSSASSSSFPNFSPLRPTKSRRLHLG